MSYYNQQQPPVGVPPPQGYPPEGYPKDAYPPPGYPPQGYPQPGYPPQGYPPQGGYPPQYAPQSTDLSCVAESARGQPDRGFGSLRGGPATGIGSLSEAMVEVTRNFWLLCAVAAYLRHASSLPSLV
ncbi:hypothetical protein C3L33_21015, partial [Rhododendron williamsianum]